MKSQEPDFSQHSRLTQHLSILDLEHPNEPGIDAAAEVQAIDSMKPGPLRWPLPSKKRRLPYLTTLVLAAAAVMLILFKQPREESVSIKGAGSVQIYVEQKGHVQSLQDAGPLEASARIQAEVLATAPALAFWGVTNRDGRLLQDGSWIWENRLRLEPLEKKLFPGSLQLDGASEGESLCVLVCPADLAKRLEQPDMMQQIQDVISSKAKPDKALAACSQSCFTLRP